MLHKITVVRVVLFGARDWRSCVEGGTGMSYDDPDLSEAYDMGVNLGQNLNEVRRMLRHPLTQHVAD